VVAGVALLSIAIAAGATGLKINVAHGLEMRTEAGILFGLADLTKIVLPIVCGVIGWCMQTRIIALVCVTTSIFCAVTAFNAGADKHLAGKQHGADQYGMAKAGVTKAEALVTSLEAQAAAEAKNKGCGKQCKFISERADKARQELVTARNQLAAATPVAISGAEKTTARISAVLFLVLIEALVWMSVPAMRLLAQPAEPKVKAAVVRKPRKPAKPKKVKDWAKIEAYSQALTRKGKPDKRRKIVKQINDNIPA
jgi:hypothetical protein